MRQGLSVSALVGRNELRILLRDRKALLLAVVLPMLLFPLLFYGMDALKAGSQRSQQESQLKLGIDLGKLDAAAKLSITRELKNPKLHFEVSELAPTQLGGSSPWSARASGEEPDPQPWKAEAEALLKEQDLLVVAHAGLREDGEFESPYLALSLVFDGSRNPSNEARRRAEESLGALRSAGLLDHIDDILGRDPASSLALQPTDLASSENAAGHKLGGLLPIILVMILISSASFAALGAFAGERESETMETLLVQPVLADCVARGKFMAVLLVACAAALGNGLSFLGASALGLGAPEGAANGPALWGLAGRVGLGMLLFLPTAVFLSALLTLVSARARSFREGQHYVLPIVLAASLLASISTQDSIPAHPLLALVPISGATLVLRDTLAGQWPVIPAILSFLSSGFWAWLLLRRLAETLDAERVFKGAETPAEAARRQASSRRALRYGYLSIAVIYIGGGRLQSAALIPGLLATLWILVPALALACARGNARSSGRSLPQSLGLVAVSPLHLLGGLLLAPGLVVLLRQFLAWQSNFLPFPPSLGVPEELLGLSGLQLVLLMAVSPAITEELLFRGAILGGLKRDLSPLKIVLWQGLLFGAVHASIYRFSVTALLGGVLALVTLRTRALWPVMLAHAAYNAINVLDLPASESWHPGLALGSSMLGLYLIFRTPPISSSPT